MAGAALAAAVTMTRADAPATGDQVRGAPPPSRGVRYVSFTGSSYDAATREFDATFATGSTVNRRWYTETLQIDDASVDLARVALNQVCLLFGHNMDEPIGKVLSAEIRNGQLVGRVKVAETAEGDQYAGMIQRGELTGISVGYNVSQWTRIIDDTKEKDDWVATRWELMEVSLVPVPADPLAGVRSAEESPGSQTVVDPGAGQLSQEEEDMQTRSATGATPGGASAVAVLAALGATDVLALRSQALTLGLTGDAADAILSRTGITKETAQSEILAAATQARASITAAGTTAAATQEIEPGSTGGLTAGQVITLRSQGVGQGIPEADVDAILSRPSISRAAASEAILEAAATRQAEQTRPAAGGAMRVGVEAQDKQRTCMIDALSARMSSTTPTEAGREFMGWRMLDMWGHRMGINERDPVRIYDAVTARMSGMELSTRAGGMMSTSDFPLLLEAAANKNLLAAYKLQEPTYREMCTRKSYNDFKPQKFLRVGDFPELLPLGEGGEIKAGKFNESREESQLATSARLVNMTRQMLINDDMGAFGDFAAGAGRSAARRENLMFYQLLLANAVLSDNVAMFHGTHGNLNNAAAVINKDSLAIARKATRKQKDIDGHPLNANLPILLVGPDKETEAEVALVEVTATKVEDKNIFAGKRRIISDALIADDSWYNLGDATSGTNFVYGYLRDQEAPQIKQDKPFNYDGMAFATIHDFGVGVIDYRFGYKFPKT
ncbi:hypothetical protein ASC70_12430 [Caulobacter sp. Root343]|nr:hypothetical protein ASC70_12430 [Caulobacter sp. Root343]